MASPFVSYTLHRVLTCTRVDTELWSVVRSRLSVLQRETATSKASGSGRKDIYQSGSTVWLAFRKVNFLGRTLHELPELAAIGIERVRALSSNC